MSEYLDLYDYRCRVAAMYQERNRALLANEDAATVLQRFRSERDDLFAHHPQSALDDEQKRMFRGLPYFPYNAAMRFVVDVETESELIRQQVVMSANEVMTMTTVGHIHFEVASRSVTLSIYWLDIYGGGLFLPFRDTTCPQQSYGGGRYLFDTMKGSDFLLAQSRSEMGGRERMILDFNYAYNPSCAYNDRWTCPLAPVENRLNAPILAGEMKYHE